jgi:hypothetical protein
MCTVIRALTVVALALPVVIVAIAVSESLLMSVPALLVGAIYAWVWLRFRPTRFVIRPDALEIVWPLKHRLILRSEISTIRVLNRHEVRRETDWAVRVGAGGLWGGFGWLWTRRRGIVQMYISRLDGFVWIERVSGRPWLITPEQPEVFARALTKHPSITASDALRDVP